MKKKTVILLPLLMFNVTVVLLFMLATSPTSSILILGVVITLTVLILAVVDHVEELSEVLTSILTGLASIFQQHKQEIDQNDD